MRSSGPATAPSGARSPRCCSPSAPRASGPLGTAPGALALALALAAATLGCGEAELIEIPIPDAVETRGYFGLTDGSCVRYRYSEGAATLFATTSITGPDETSVAGRSAYRWRLVRQASTQPEEEWLIEAQDDGELRLLRSIETQEGANRLTRTYTCFGDGCGDPDAEEPLLLGLEFEADALALPVGSTFVTTTTPELSAGEPAPEEHTVTVLDEPTLPGPAGDVAGKELLYQRAVGVTQPRTIVLGLVPGVGLATLRLGSTRYTACDWRVCDTDGNCEGPPTCAELSCS